MIDYLNFGIYMKYVAIDLIAKENELLQAYQQEVKLINYALNYQLYMKYLKIIIDDELNQTMNLTTKQLENNIEQNKFKMLLEIKSLQNQYKDNENLLNLAIEYLTDSYNFKTSMYNNLASIIRTRVNLPEK